MKTALLGKLCVLALALISVNEVAKAPVDQIETDRFQMVQTPTGKGCPKGTRWDQRSAMCKRTG